MPCGRISICDATIAAIRMAARLEGMLTDPVYEGKSMAGLRAMARAGEIAPGSKVLYVHLGGAPVLSAYHRAFAWARLAAMELDELVYVALLRSEVPLRPPGRDPIFIMYLIADARR